ncbi:MAG: hypothetical protein ACLR0U_31095 [Enterocloster clostridioformis]
MDYGIDLSGCTKEELIYRDLFADIPDNDTSPWHRYAREMGLNHVDGGLSGYSAAPSSYEIPPAQRQTPVCWEAFWAPSERPMGIYADGRSPKLAPGIHEEETASPTPLPGKPPSGL